MIKPLPTETEVLKHAEIAARYWRGLVAEGISESAAAVMAAMYVAGLLPRQDTPQEPWERE